MHPIFVTTKWEAFMSEKKRKTKAQRIYSVLSSRKRINQDLIELYKSQREQEFLQQFLDFYKKPS